MSVLESLAVALDVPLAELAAESPVVAAVTEEQPTARSLRLVLSGAYSLSAMLQDRRPAAITRLRGRARDGWRLVHAAMYADLADLLGSLVPDLESAARQLPEARQAEAFELLATTYQACSAALAKLGEPEAAWIAADRAMDAAERAGNPMLVAAGAFRLVFVFLAARHYDQAEEMARTAADALRAAAEAGDPAAMSLWGGLTLQRAVIASRLNDSDTAYSQLDLAKDVAGNLGEGRNDFDTEFGPAKVSIHEVAIAIELGDAGRALRVASGLDASRLSPERQSRLLIDVARAHAQRRQADEAVAALLQAEEIAPDQVRGHEVVRQLVNDLMAVRERPTSGLRDLAARLTARRLD